MNLEDLLDQIKTDLTGDENADMAATIAADMVKLQSRAALGEDVQGELDHLKAQGLNLSAAARIQIERRVIVFLTSAITKVVSGVFPAQSWFQSLKST